MSTDTVKSASMPDFNRLHAQTLNQNTSNRLTLCLTITGILLLVYAVAGNYVALPGYIRFLERGGKSAAGNTFDMSVLFGATKTILWMYSFQLGVFALVIARSLQTQLHTKTLAGFGLLWLIVWSWPSLPAPGPWFYITFGSANLLCIIAVLRQDSGEFTGKTSQTFLLASLAFFAFATWEVCGLGSTGRMLHPEQAAKPLAHNILVTQSSKLMFEFLFAWSLLLLSLVVGRKPA